MLDPRYLQHIAEGAEEISSELHSYIIRRIIDRMMIRIGRGEEYLFTSADRWQIEIMQGSGALLEDIIPEIHQARAEGNQGGDGRSRDKGCGAG